MRSPTTHPGRLMLALLLLTVVAPRDGHAEWTQTNGPTGTGLYSFVSLNGSIFACAGGGIFRSTDEGVSWTIRGYAWPPNVTSLATEGTRLFAGTRAGDVLVSTDQGVAWVSIRNDLPVSPVAMLLIQRNTILVILDSDSIYRSTDGGTHWAPSGQGGVRPGPFIYELTCRDSCVLAGGYNGVFRSTDLGLTWSRANEGLTDTSIHALTFKDSLVFAGTQHKGVFVSSDLGRTWSLTEPPPQAMYGVWTIIAPGTVLYAGTQAGVCVSTDNGGSWSTVSNGLPQRSHRIVWELFAQGKTILARTTEGQFRSTNAGAVWIPSDSGLSSATVYALYASPTGMFAGTQWRGVFHTGDCGTSWHPRNSGLLDTVITGDIYAFASYGRFLFAGTGNDAYRSPDQGATWARTRLNTGNVTAFAVRDSFLFASWSGVSRSPDSGATWQLALTGLTDGIDAFLVRGHVLIAGSSWSGVARTTDNGTSWVRAGDTWGVGINCLLGADALCYAGTYGRGVYRSSDDGEHWSPTAGDPGSLYVWSMAYVAGTVFAGTQKGIWASTDGGGSWSNVGGPGVECPIYALAADDACLYAGTSERGVWRRPLNELITSAGRREDRLTSGVSLEQNFPNPFNPSTTIRYAVPARSRVTLAIFTTLGQQIAVLRDGEEDAGQHEVQLHARDLPSGVYFYRLTVAGATATRRLVVIR